jgi:hypothetical protein
MIPTTAFWVWVDVATTAWVFLLHHKSFSFLSLAMFFPAVAAVVTEALWGDLPSFLRVAVVGIPTAPRVSLPLALTLAIGVPYLFVHACKWFSIAMDWGHRQPRGGDGSSAAHASTTAGELVAAPGGVVEGCWGGAGMALLAAATAGEEQGSPGCLRHHRHCLGAVPRGHHGADGEGAWCALFPPLLFAVLFGGFNG